MNLSKEIKRLYQYNLTVETTHVHYFPTYNFFYQIEAVCLDAVHLSRTSTTTTQRNVHTVVANELTSVLKRSSMLKSQQVC